jgi:hypothetical protein
VFLEIGMALAFWAERRFSDALVFTLVAMVIVPVAGLDFGSAAGDLVKALATAFGS